MNNADFLGFGWYETLITDGLDRILESNERQDLILREPLDEDAFRNLLLLHLQKILRSGFAEITIEKQVELTKKLISLIGKDDPDLLEEIPILILSGQEKLGSLLRGIVDPALSNPEAKEKAKYEYLPKSGFTSSELFTGKKPSESLDAELKREILSAKRVDVLVSFIRFSGLRLLIDTLKRATESGVQVRIITTTYLGATEAKALEALSELSNTEIKISYNQLRGRLHAKGWVFSRQHRLGTAYVGSSNLSKDAITDGLEWNIKITQVENETVYKAIQGTFDSLWEDQEFERFIWVADKERLISALSTAKYVRDSIRLTDLSPELMALVREYLKPKSQPDPVFESLNTKQPYTFQHEILDRLQAERQLHGRNRNLVVLPTGSGKTMVAAFDYKRLCAEAGHRLKLLFVAHRQEILEQAKTSYAKVLGDPNFGQLWTGNIEPGQWTHLFATIQTLNSRQAEFKNRWSDDWFEVIVIDEAHHGVAESYQFVLNQLKPKFLLGLTATPERMDGKPVDADFHGVYAVEMRLYEGINKDLLSPFHYFGISQGMPDLSEVKWSNGRYNDSDLEKRLLSISVGESVLAALERNVVDIREVHALGFCCNKKHAEFMANLFKEKKLRAESLTSDDELIKRQSILGAFASGTIQYLFSVNLFNEGLDIPHVDTVLFLRPTESLTIFLQQLGRGLRFSPGKSVLTVLDFVSQSNKDYDFSHKFEAMLGKERSGLEKEVEEGFPSLPAGCAISLERKTQQIILDHIKRQIPSSHRKILEKVQASRSTSMAEFLKTSNLNPELILHHGGLWYQMQRELQGKGSEGIEAKREESLCRFIREILLQADSTHQLELWMEALMVPDTSLPGVDWICQEWNAFTNINSRYFTTSIEMWNWLIEDSIRREEVEWWVKRQLDATQVLERPLLSSNPKWGHMRLFGSYTQKGVSWILGRAEWAKSDVTREGVERLQNYDRSTYAWILYVNIRKSEMEFSRSTMYKDWAVNDHVFQWDSPNNWVSMRGQGERFLTEVKGDVPVFLFVRERKKDQWNRTTPYTFLGPVKLIKDSVEGDRPITMRFHLSLPIPTAFFRKICIGAVS